MLPRLELPDTRTDTEQNFILALTERGFAGDIETSHGSRSVIATDNSIYQRFPSAVLFPTNTHDVVLIAELSGEARFRNLTFCPRGGGTSTNGQSLSTGFIVDMSRHMNRILEINIEQGWARVEAGVVKDQLNAAVKSAGYFFAPDLSTSNRATIGGMVNTDASGQGSCVYGKTRDHVLGLRSVLPGGDVWDSFPFDDEQLNSALGEHNRWGEIYRIANDILRENKELIETTYPVLNRALTGYDLANVLGPDGKFDLNSVLCGSEGTLAFITEATVKLEKLPAYTAVIVIEYSDFVGALRHGHQLMQLKPTAIETLDSTVMGLAKSDEIWASVQHLFQQAEQLAALNIIELSAETESELNESIERITRLLENHQRQLLHQSNKSAKIELPSNALLGYGVVQKPKEQNQLWTMRKKAVGLLGNMPGHARPVPFVEDTAVPPQHLADFIEEFRALLDAHQLRYGMFGHGDAGVIHVRPALDMRDQNSLATVRTITDKVYALVSKYGGVLWGEHGKGLRSEYSPATFGELYPQLQRIKAAFDPYNQMNPGKLATPNLSDRLLGIDSVPTRGQRDRLIPADTWDTFTDALYCNGNGACFNWDPDAVMCPSYKGTRNRQYSPKGRATLFKEWLTQLSRQDYSVRYGIGEPRLVHWPRRLMASLKKRDTDFNQEVFQSMDECLACKACASQCPIQVDVPAFRSVFLQHYYSRYLRPLRHLLVANIERSIPWFATFPRLYNGFTQFKPTSTFITWLTGLCDMPAMRPVRWRRALKLLGIAKATPARLSKLNATDRTKTVVLVMDVFTRYFETELVLDCCRLLKHLGFIPLIAPFYANGKPAHVVGMLERFKKTAENTSNRLLQLASFGVPLVGLEPSMTLCYRKEYATFVDEKIPQVLQLSEWLVHHRDQLHEHRYLFERGHCKLLPHCSEAAVNPESVEHWRTVFELLGQTLEVEQLGCCGMAGTYGHEVHHRATSEKIYQLSWQARINDDTDGRLCVSGFSCRDQAARFSGKRLPHPLQLLLAKIKPQGRE